jgi:hypothetical protein
VLLGAIVVVFTGGTVPNNKILTFLKASFLQRVLRDFQTD